MIPLTTIQDLFDYNYSPVLSNILLTPFDREMRLRGYQLTRFADDWVVTCRSAAEARAAMDAARRILKQLGVELHPQKTRIVHVRYGFEFLGYKIKCGWRKLYLPGNQIRSRPNRMRSTRIPRRSRFVVSWIRYGNHQTDDTSANRGTDCGA